MSVVTRLRTAVRSPAYDIVERFPRVWRAYIRVRNPHGHLVTPDSDIVVDGFQGSAQTFARHALLIANLDRKVASHMHNPAHLVVAVRMGIPAVLVVRHPIDAVSSWVAREEAPGTTDPLDELCRWKWFHQRLLPHLSGMIVASFDEVTHAFGDVVERVNRRFDESFVPYAHNDRELTAALMKGMHHYSLQTRGEVYGEIATPTPSPVREGKIAEVRGRLLEPDLASLRSELQHLFEHLLAAT